jgi:hypothetical protein
VAGVLMEGGALGWAEVVSTTGGSEVGWVVGSAGGGGAAAAGCSTGGASWTGGTGCCGTGAGDGRGRIRGMFGT